MICDMSFSLASMPQGARLSEASWLARHRVVVRLLWVHVPVLVIVGLAGPRPLWEAVLLPASLGAIAALTAVLPSHTSQATATSLGLIAGTFVAIELSG